MDKSLSLDESTHTQWRPAGKFVGPITVAQTDVTPPEERSASA